MCCGYKTYSTFENSLRTCAPPNRITSPTGGSFWCHSPQILIHITYKATHYSCSDRMNMRHQDFYILVRSQRQMLYCSVVVQPIEAIGMCFVLNSLP